MEPLCDLLFELSSTTRLELMTKLQNGGQKLSHLSHELDLPTSEVSRHLQRLSEAKLIQKDFSGLYVLTSYGEEVYGQLKGLEFISRNRDFFNDHRVSSIPYEFHNRMGELAASTLGDHIFTGLEEAEKSIASTKELMWIMTDRVFNRLALTLAGKLSSTLDSRIILPEGIMPQDREAPIPSTAPGVQKRVLPSVDVVILVSDNDAVVCILQQNGKMDYTGFRARDPLSYKWCKDLFLYYWDKAKPSAIS